VQTSGRVKVAEEKRKVGLSTREKRGMLLTVPKRAVKELRSEVEAGKCRRGGGKRGPEFQGKKVNPERGSIEIYILK